jgi:CTP synthase
MAKFIFVTGGVVSSLGKGITASSIGLLLKSRGLKVALQKFDPYLNIDPGTMNPYQHGEVYVTDDGTEADLDLGHYERFTGITTNKYCNYTAGKIYDSVLKKERKGNYLGDTIQIVPHITNEICENIKNIATPDIDVVICEIGGTVGDIESLIFLEALRQFKLQIGKNNTLFIHVTFIPYLEKAGEIKTKPTQHSVGKLREIGIIPDILICRTQKNLNKDIRKKIALFCNVEEKAVIEAIDVPNTIYEVPLEFASQELDTIILDYLGLQTKRRNLKAWRDYVDKVINAKNTVEIALIGKYSKLPDAYKSIYEALNHAATHLNTKVIIKNILSEEIEEKGIEKIIKNCTGILIPGGFGIRGVKGKIIASQYARENNIPFFGICYGMHIAVIEFARNILNLKDADTTENNPCTPHPVIHLMEEQKKVMNLGGTMRLGSFPCIFTENSLIKKLYKKNETSERHRHRYEFNNNYKNMFENAGMLISGLSPDKILVETIEIPSHPWFIGVQFHPEFKSNPINPHPLFKGFIEASLKKKNLLL